MLYGIVEINLRDSVGKSQVFLPDDGAPRPSEWHGEHLRALLRRHDTNAVGAAFRLQVSETLNVRVRFTLDLLA